MMKSHAPASLLLLAIAAVCLFLFLGRGQAPGAGSGGLQVQEAAPGAESSATQRALEAPPLADTPNRHEAQGTNSGEARTSVPQQPTIAAQALFRIIDTAGDPVEEARVLIARDGEVLFDGPTNAAGDIELAADGEEAALVIRISNRPLELHSVRLSAGRQELQLLEGTRLAGRLVVEQGPPAADLRLLLGSSRLLPGSADIPEVILERTGSWSTSVLLAQTTTDAQGRFEFSGLQQTWSGSLRLPAGWRVLKTTEGKLLPHASGASFERPAEGLVLRVARDDILRGRLLSQGGQALDGARLSAGLTSPESATRRSVAATTDEQGRFELRLHDIQITNIQLRMGEGQHGSPTLLSLDEGSIPADGDLGDLFVSDVRDVPFVLVDPEQEPVRGGVATAGGVRSTSSDKSGRGVLRWIPTSVQHMRVEAQGFVPLEAPLPITVQSPLVLQLQPANRLEVRITPPAGGDVASFKVVLLAESRLTASPVAERTQQFAHVGMWGYPFPSLVSKSLDSYLVAIPDQHDGLVLFRALQAGIELQLEVRGLSGDMVYHRETLTPLGPAEVRQLEVVLDEAITTFRGRVLDLEGNPLPRAFVQLGGQILGFANDAGEFACFVKDPPQATLLVQHKGHATRYLHDYVIPTDGKSVEFHLKPAQRVEVLVLDEAGAPVPQAEVWVKYSGFTTNTHRIEGARHLIGSAPEGLFQIVVNLANRNYVQEHDPAQPEARVIVPVHGRVLARVPAATTAGRTGQFLLVLRPQDGGEATLGSSRESGDDLQLRIPAALPGAYQATLQYEPSEQELASGRQAQESDSVAITVVAGAEVELSIGL